MKAPAEPLIATELRPMSILAHPPLSIRHPAWCDPRLCTVEAMRGGTFLAVHVALTADGDATVEVRQAEEVSAEGTVLSAERAIVACQAPDELTPEQALTIAGAIAAAAGFASGALTPLGGAA
jgi:hypothetical protein